MSDQDFEERTCLECLQVKVCHRVLAVCQDCFRRVLAPAMGIDLSPVTPEEEQWAARVAEERA